MNLKILSFACLSLLAVFRSTPESVAADPVESPVPASVEAADREFLTALESGAAVNPAPAQPAKAAPVTRVEQTPEAVAVTKKSSRDVSRAESPRKTVTAKTSAPAPKAKRTTPARKAEVVEVRRALPVERTTVITTVTRHDRDDDDDDDDDDDKDEDRDEPRGRDDGFLSRLFSR